MIFLWRTFVRKRAIPLATSASVAATSLALVQIRRGHITFTARLPAPSHAEQAKDLEWHEGDGACC